jgi:adenylate kinase
VIKTLKTSELDEPKTLVLLSSVMSWYNTPAKFTEEKKDDAEEEEAEEEAPEDEEEEEEKEEGNEEEKDGPVDENGEPIVRQKPLFYKESDYHLRVPHERYQHLKTLETLALSSTTTQEKLRVHVMCAGIRYGNGERIFYDHFQQAWIQNPRALPIIGKGENLIPTIHIIDLAGLVKRVVIENPKVHPYIFAIDKTKKPT